MLSLLLILFLQGGFPPALASAALEFVNSGLQEGSEQMNLSASAQAGELSPNLVPFFSDRTASLIIAKINARHSNPVNNVGLETGFLDLFVVRVIHSPALKEGHSVRTPFARIADPEIRFRNQFNLWNALPLDEGNLLLLFVKPNGSPDTYVSLSAERLTSPSDPDVSAASECYAIELLGDDLARKRELLARALQGSSDLSRFYALDVLIQRHAFNRMLSAEILESALTYEKIPANAKRDLGFQLASADFFDESLAAEPVNVGIVSTFAKQLVAAPDAASRGTWLNFLSSCISREFSTEPKLDREMRLALVKAVHDPNSQHVISTLAVAVREAPSADDAQSAKDLLQVWQSAHGHAR